MSLGLRATTAFAALYVAASASAQLRVMNYNIAHIGGDPTAIANVIAAAHSDNKAGWAKPIDIMLFQEVSASTVGALQDAVNLAAPVGTSYARATYTTSGTEDSAAGAQCAFYRVQTIAETVSGHVDIPTGASRNTDRWLFKLVGYSSSAASVYAYSSHLKASIGFENERETGALAIRQNSNALGVGVRAIYVGDYNLYSNTEPAYLAFLAAGNGQGNDELGTGSWSGSSNAWKHTQSPRLASGTLVGGGMDDRFDFHLMTNQLSDDEGISVIAGTYRALGNDGNHFDIAINTGVNTYYPSERTRSNTLATNIFNASDHIPVLVDYQVPAVMAATFGAVPARVIQGASASAAIAVQNTASVVTAVGADELDYTVTGAGGLLGSASGVAPLAPASASAVLAINTGSVGVLAFEAQVTSSSEAVQNGAIVLPAQCTVLARAKPSWQSAAVATSISVPISILAGGGNVDVDVPLHNIAWQSLQSKLDADWIGFPTGSAVSLLGPLPTSIAATPGVLRLRINPTGLPAGLTTVGGTLLTSDENVPGEGDTTLTISIAITVGGMPPRPGDLNGDGLVNASDLTMLLAQWSTSGSADINSSGSVDGGDLAILLSNWG